MSFCGKCGTQIEEGGRFCPNCGTAVEIVQQAAPVQCSVGVSDGVGSNLKESLSSLGENKNLFIAGLVMLTINAFWGVIETFKLSDNLTGGNLVSESMSLHYFLAQSGVGFLTIISILIVLLSAVFMFLPILKKQEYKAKNLLFAKIMSICSLAFFLLCVIILIAYTASEGQGMVKFGLTLGGWFFLIETIALVIVLFRLASKLKKSNEQ
ncbi:MAG: zinc ribbon domain-containing protein [Clostridiales bacterium]|jgi:hypothetical protein|nr:zinc ribbon domain-containing protein [Clostridiales bacterium]